MLWFGSYYTAKFEKFFFFAQNVHVADVVRLPFGYFFDSTRTNLIEWHKHHVDCAQEERTCFAFVFIEIDQKKVAKLHDFRAPKNVNVADVVRLPFGQFFDSTRTNLIV